MSKKAIQPIYYEAEKIFGEWFSGNNRLKIKGFDMIDDDLNLLVAYVKCFPADAIHPILESLLTSPYLRKHLTKTKKGISLFNVVPTITFVEIRYPYIEEYNTIVKRYGLKPYLLCDDETNTPLTDCFVHSNGGYPVYMSIVRLGEILIVNMLPGIAEKNPTPKDETVKTEVTAEVGDTIKTKKTFKKPNNTYKTNNSIKTKKNDVKK